MIKRFIFGVLTAVVVSLTLHIFMLHWINPIVSAVMSHHHVVPVSRYGFVITFFAYLSMLPPVFVLAFVFYYFGDMLPGKTRFTKGVVLGLILLALRGELLRMPLMNVLVGNPVAIALLQQAQVWIYNLSMTVLIALIIPMKQAKHYDAIH